jgi:molecular chaperone GrpE
MKKDKPDKLEHQDLQEKYIRALADYQNLEKRVERERETFVKFANTILILKMLPVLDNLERAGEHHKDQGIDLVIKQFREALQGEGVTEIEAKGVKFNPEVHEAVEQVPGEEGKVMEVLEKGYQLGEKVIRPTKVKIGGKKE